MRLEYYQCDGCEEIIERDEFHEKTIHGSKDHTGFQIDPDEYYLVCPHCGGVDQMELGCYEMVEIIKNLQAKIEGLKNSVRMQRDAMFPALKEQSKDEH